jgi:hypothetical protein
MAAVQTCEPCLSIGHGVEHADISTASSGGAGLIHANHIEGPWICGDERHRTHRKRACLIGRVRREVPHLVAREMKGCGRDIEQERKIAQVAAPARHNEAHHFL